MNILKLTSKFDYVILGPIRSISTMENQRNNLKSLFLRVVDAVKPVSLFKNNEKIKREFESIQKLNDKNLHVVGFGKAVLGMAVEVEKAFPDRIGSGIISVPVGTLDRFKDYKNMKLNKNSKIQIFECAKNNLPDERAVEVAVRIREKVKELGQDDILIVLVSGGGSALLPLPINPVTLIEKLEVIRKLTQKGATIQEVNTLRIVISDLKGGKLLSSAKNAYKVITLVISDIINDPLELIASGATVPSFVTKEDAVNVLKKYNLFENIPESVKKILNEKSLDKIEHSGNFETIVIGSNEVAINSLLENNIIFLSKSIIGNVEELSVAYCKMAEIILTFLTGDLTESDFKFKLSSLEAVLNGSSNLAIKILENKRDDFVIVAGGEPTVNIKGNGIGGRNQELALRFSIESAKNRELLKEVVFLSAGTDGIDGPTVAAGAIGGCQIMKEYNSQIPIETFVTNNDSYSFYANLSNGKYHVITGHTATNVMDLHLLYIPKIMDRKQDV